MKLESVKAIVEALGESADRMTVFQLWSDAHRETPIYVFVAEPFDFDGQRV